MDFTGGPPFNNNQDFGIPDLWLPATPVKDVSTRRPLISRPSYGQRNQASEPTWLDLVAGAQATTPPWGFPFQSEACNSIPPSGRLQDLSGSPAVAEASTSQATTGCSVPNRHNASLMNRWSSRIGEDILPPFASSSVQNGSGQVMFDSSNQPLLDRNAALFSQKTHYGSPITFLPTTLNSFPQTSMSFDGTGAIPCLLNPMTAENYGQRRQDKHHQPLEKAREEKFLMEELCANASFSNLIASSEYALYQKTDCGKVPGNQSDEMSIQQIRNEKGLEEGENEVMELNEASNKKLRKKKHRPKVIIEGKSARTPKPGTPKTKTPKPTQDKEKGSGKRKYTRRKKDTASFPETSDLGEIVESDSRSGAKSVRRSLNFDAEETQNADKFSVLMSMFMKNLENPEEESCKNGDLTGSRLKETVDSNVAQGSRMENTIECPKASMIEPQHEYLIQSPVWSTTVKQNVGAPINIVKSNCVLDAPRGTKRDQYPTSEASELETAYLMHSYNAGGSASRNHNSERQGSCLYYSNKRLRMETGPNAPLTHNPSSKLAFTPSGWRTVHPSNNPHEFTFTETMKLMAQEKLQTLERMLLCEETDVNTYNYQTLSNNLTSLTGAFDYRRNSAPVNPSWKNTNTISQPPTPEKPSGYSKSQESKICGRLMKFETSEDVNKPVKVKGRRGRKKKEEDTPVNPLPSINSTGASTRHGENLNHEIISFNREDPRNYKASTNSSFPSISPYMDCLEYIIQKLRRLSLNRDSELASSQSQNAIVPYVRNVGMMVPYEGPFVLAKRRRPRPKVDLDPETNRVWKLLMGIEGGGNEPAQVDKEKWWEEERRVFRGRVDSFIARMHLVQGDRRFSQWKGSVVDSVIGVFLTQNVSDHLSSSAYMALAAKFPHRSRANSRTSNIEEVQMPMENHIECIKPLTTPPNLQRNILDHSFYSQASLETNAIENEGKKENSSSNETLRCGSVSSAVYCTGKIESHETDLNFGQDSPNSGSNTGVTTRSVSSLDVEDRRLVEEAVSSQNSVVSSQSSTGYQVLSDDHIGSNLTLNIEADDLLTGRMSTGFGCSSFTELLHIAESHKFQELYSNSISSANSQMIHKIEDGFPVLDKLDNSKVTCQPYQADFAPHHTAFSLSNMLPESQFFCPLRPNFTILESNVRTLQEGLGSSLHGNKFEVNHGECSESAAENLLPSDSLNKLLSTSGSASTIDPYLPIRIQDKEQSKFSETEVGIDNQSLSHKSLAEITEASSHNDNSNQCPCIQAEAMERLQQNDGHSTLEAETSHNAVKVHVQMDNFTCMKTSTVSNRKEQNKLDVDQTNGSNLKDEANKYHKVSSETPKQVEKARRKKVDSEKKAFDWDSLRKEVNQKKPARERSSDTKDSLDWEAVRCADVSEISETIRERGMNNMLAERIKDFLNRLVREHGSIDLEWLRDVPSDKSKDFLLSIRGLGLKSAECVRLLTLHHLAFPVDTNVGRICVRLGWVPLQPLPESLQLHLLELYPVLETIQKYLWPRLCKLDQRTLYELHYQMITFGKVFCTKSKPNCNACPMRGECRHFASAFASARLALPPPEDKSIVSSTYPVASEHGVARSFIPRSILELECSSVSHELNIQKNCEPIIEEPATPEAECQETLESAIEDAFFQDPDEIPTIKLNFEKFTQNLHNFMQENMELQDGDMSKALVALTPEAASLPVTKLKNISRLRTEHQVYEIPDSHRLLEGLDQREPDDPCPYLLAIWTPGETAQSIEPPKDCCNSQDTGQQCDRSTCFACSSKRESQAHTVRGTLLIPCRTAMRGSFPLNGTYFQVNEVFADHHSSRNPIDIPRDWIWNLPRRTVCFGTSIPTIFRGLTTEGIQQCFWRGFVCVRGFDRVTRAPKPLYARLHFPASKAPKYRKGGVAAAAATAATAAREGE